MPSSNVELIKEKLDIVEFLKGYLTLHPAGKNFKASCPFHSEKTPSFMISPERQSWHCFGCNLGGDAFSFLMRYENIEFSEALKILAEKVGVELRSIASGDYKFTGLLYDINRAAVDYFRSELARANVPREYLASRKLKNETIEEFELGWAPNQSDALNLYLLQRGFYPEDIIRAGLVLKSERGLQFDRFRGRVMFPIHNNFGKVVGFTGRVLPSFAEAPAVAKAMADKSAGKPQFEVAKYVNSPETPIFVKSKLLYGFWKSKNHIREANAAFLVEGQMDFLMSWQAGVRNAIASSGTALTLDHLRSVRRMTDQLLISFDTDEAGWAAGERAIDLAEANDFNVKVVLLSGVKDPAEAAEKDPKILKDAITNAQPALEFYFQKYLPAGTTHGTADREYLKSIRAILAKIRHIASSVHKSFWMKELSKRTGIEEKVLMEEMEKLGVSGFEVADQKKIAEEIRGDMPNFSRRELLSQCVLAAAHSRNNFDILKESLSYLSPEYQAISRILQQGETKAHDARMDSLLNIILLRGSSFGDDEIKQIQAGLLEEYRKEKRHGLAEAVKRAEAKGDEAALRAALEEMSVL